MKYMVITGCTIALLLSACTSNKDLEPFPSLILPPESGSGTESESVTNIEPAPVTASGISVIPVIARDNNDTYKYLYDVTYPQLTGMQNTTIQNAINAHIKETIDKEIAAFTEDSKSALDPEAQDVNGSILDVSYEISLLNENIVSFEITSNEYIAGAAHPFIFSAGYNYDLTTGAPLAIADLFKMNPHYLDDLSALTRAHISDQLRQNDFTDYDIDLMMLSGTEPLADNFQTVVFTENNLVVIFDPYAVAPYSMGSLHVPIPYNSLNGFRKPF